MSQESFRIGLVGYDAPTDTIDFHRTPDEPDEDYFYWFERSRITTYREYQDWFEHLSHKQWFTPEVKYNLVDVLEKLGECGNFDGTENEPPFSRGI